MAAAYTKFIKTSRTVILGPIDRLLQSMGRLQKNPLGKQSDPAESPGALSPRPQANSAAAATATVAPSVGGMLERTLEKLTGLLQVGFGEAGSAIIQQCMRSSADGDLDPLVDGNKVSAIWGFCDIRRFTDATECLKEDVMVFVNEIASIVHGQVSALDGHPNKNIGDAFLLVWRMPIGNSGQELIDITRNNWPSDDESVALHGPLADSQAALAVLQRSNFNAALNASWAAAHTPTASAAASSVLSLATKSLTAFIRIIVDIQLSEPLKRFTENPRIREKFSDFKVELGFGLHVGWAIEGPIGSRYKIDASYLSPHVNLAETLEALTKVYGVPLLMSGDFVALLPESVRRLTRLVDIVKTGRSTVQLWTFDIVQSDIQMLGLSWLQHNAPNAAASREFPLAAVHRSIPADFFLAHRRALSLYISGHWAQATELFAEASRLYPADKSTKALQAFMKDCRGRPPSGWTGAREV